MWIHHVLAGWLFWCVLGHFATSSAKGKPAGAPREGGPLLAKWKERESYQYQDAAENSLAVLLDGEPDGDEKFTLVALANGKPVTAEDKSVGIGRMTSPWRTPILRCVA